MRLTKMSERPRYILRRIPIIGMVLSPLLMVACTGGGTSTGDPRHIVGTIGPTAIQIPSRDLLFYEPEPGTKQLKGKCERPLRSMVIQLRWPGLEPLGPGNAEDYRVHHLQSVGDSQWLEIGLTRLANSEHVTLAATRDFELFRERSVTGYPLGVPLEQGEVAEIGLLFARTRDRLPNTLGSIVYTDRLAVGQEPSALIVCGHGPQYAPPRWTALCNQHVIESALPRVKVRISYRANLLGQWPQITSAVHAYLKQAPIDCATPSELEVEHG